MKTLGRILIILTAFVIVMGITYVAVNAGGLSSSGGMPQFENDRGSLPANGQFEQPEFGVGQFEGRPEDRERGGGWMFGLIKNVGMIAVVVMLIALPRRIKRNKKRSAPAVLAE
jgi:hypothetical protein